MQYFANFVECDLNTAHPVYTNGVTTGGVTWAGLTFRLVEEGPREHQGGGIVKWNRTYAATPATYSEWESFIYTFPGYVGNQPSTTGTGPFARDPQVLRVESRLLQEFFLTGTGTSYPTAGDIPVVMAQKFRIHTGALWWVDVLPSLTDNPPFPIASTPSRSTYESWIGNAITSKWSSGIVRYAWGTPSAPALTDTSDASPGQIAAEDSSISRWMGNIWRRTTRYVLAQ
jgi:hypothetical protein